MKETSTPLRKTKAAAILLGVLNIDKEIPMKKDKAENKETKFKNDFRHPLTSKVSILGNCF